MSCYMYTLYHNTMYMYMYTSLVVYSHFFLHVKLEFTTCVALHYFALILDLNFNLVC